MKVLTLDGLVIDSKETLHTLLARELGFPSWYGGNLDALFDCLTDVREVTTITLCHEDAFHDTLGPYGQRVLRVLGDAAKENPRIQVQII